jgi:hypothetical protein
MALSRRTLSGAGAGAGLVDLAAAPHAAAGEAAPAGLVGAPGATASRSRSLLPIASRNSVFPRSGAGPLYWNIYGWSFPHIAAIPEDEWKADIDWLARDLAPHGYTMACTDGWIEGSSHTTEHGYVITYTLSGHEATGYARMAGEDQSVTFSVEAPRAGTYRLDLRYHALQAARLTLGVERPDRTVVTPPRPLAFGPTSNRWATPSGRIRLAQGENLLVLMRTAGDSGSIALNYVDIG